MHDKLKRAQFEFLDTVSIRYDFIYLLCKFDGYCIVFQATRDAA